MILSIVLICASTVDSAEYLLQSSWRRYENSDDNVTLTAPQINNITENNRFPNNQTFNQSSTQRFELFYQEVPEEAFISMVVISTVIAFIASGLLLHLLAFHVYIKAIGKIKIL